MTNHERILHDLSIGQSTSDSIAGRLGLPTAAVQLLCKQLVAKKQIETLHLSHRPDIEVYRLTSDNKIPCSTSIKPARSSKSSPPFSLRLNQEPHVGVRTLAHLASGPIHKSVLRTYIPPMNKARRASPQGTAADQIKRRSCRHTQCPCGLSLYPSL